MNKIIPMAGIAFGLFFANLGAHAEEFKLPNLSYEAYKFELSKAFECKDDPATAINESLSCPGNRLLNQPAAIQRLVYDLEYNMPVLAANTEG